MFGWGGGIGSSLVGVDVDRERTPPAQPTPLDFPQYDPPGIASEANPATFDTLYRQLMAIRKPQDISVDHIKTLNLQVVRDVPASNIVPEELLRGLPPLPWEEPQAPESGQEASSHLMGNGNPYPPRDKYDVAKTELLFDNDDAFRELARMAPRPGRQRVRLTQSRKFWAGLERMAQYWDTSLDNYYEKPVQPQKSTNGETKTDATQTDETLAADKAGDDKMDVDSPQAEKPQVETVYTGRRIGAGHEMPEDAREDTLRGLLEMAAWPFGCQAAVPSLPPRLAVRNLLFPVRQSLVAGRAPQDRQTARKGILEGPVLVVQCRPETSFREPNEAPGQGQREMCDLIREVGAMLLTAQERAREGSVEVKPGEGKWWTTTPRWGGAPNDGVPIDTPENTDSKPEEEEATGHANKRSRYADPRMSSRRQGPSNSRKASAAEKWKTLQAGPSLWDKKMRYMQIGKPKNSPFDDIYMISSINHHVSIVHLRVHRRYLDYITHGKSDFHEESGSSDQPWYALSLRRTRWYDLMKAEERLEAFEGVWRVFHYLMRNNPD
ncbi:hypothetical protein VTN96DRAFT_1383 [Rasamsonia emersonii]